MNGITKKPIILLVILMLTVFSASLFGQASDDAKAAFNEALNKEKAGDLNAAITSYKACIKSDPEFVDAYINLGTIYYGQKNYEEAEKTFKTATEKDPQAVNAFANLGKVQYSLRRYAESENSFKAAIAINPSADLYKELGKVYYKKKNDKEVITTLNKCHEAGGGDYLTYYMLGKSYQRENKDADAIKALNMSNTKKNNYNAHSALGSIYLGQEKYTKAAAAFQSALKANPKKYRAAYNYAVAIENASPDDYSSHIKNWENFVRIAKNNPKAKNDISIAQQHIKDLKDAQENAQLQ